MRWLKISFPATFTSAFWAAAGEPGMLVLWGPHLHPVPPGTRLQSSEFPIWAKASKSSYLKVAKGSFAVSPSQTSYIYYSYVLVEFLWNTLKMTWNWGIDSSIRQITSWHRQSTWSVCKRKETFFPRTPTLKKANSLSLSWELLGYFYLKVSASICMFHNYTDKLCHVFYIISLVKATHLPI